MLSGCNTNFWHMEFRRSCAHMHTWLTPHDCVQITLHSWWSWCSSKPSLFVFFHQVLFTCVCNFEPHAPILFPSCSSSQRVTWTVPSRWQVAPNMYLWYHFSKPQLKDHYPSKAPCTQPLPNAARTEKVKLLTSPFSTLPTPTASCTSTATRTSCLALCLGFGLLCLTNRGCSKTTVGWLVKGLVGRVLLKELHHGII